MIYTPEQALKKLAQIASNGFKAFSYQQLTVTGTLSNLTVPEGSRYALIVVESDISTICARYLETGQTTVSSGIGMPLLNGTVFDIEDMQNLTSFQVIQEAAGTHKLNIQYYK